MGDSSQSLHLIERAIKRLGNVPNAGSRQGVDSAHGDLSETPSLTARSKDEFSQDTRAAGEGRAAVERKAAPQLEVGLDYKEMRRNGLLTPDNMASELSNQFRAIKRKLLINVLEPKSRVAVNNLVMVTSSKDGEGKTFSSLNLAVSLAAERDLQVLLIDSDFIRQTVAKFFEPTDGTGLTDYLNGTCRRISDITYRCKDLPKLSAIFAGKRDESSPELVASRRMVDFLTEISKQHTDRIVIIDTLPVLAAVEPATMAMHVHQLIMVVAAEDTNQTELRKSLEAVSACRNITLLFNKAPKWSQNNSNYYYPAGA